MQVEQMAPNYLLKKVYDHCPLGWAPHRSQAPQYGHHYHFHCTSFKEDHIRINEGVLPCPKTSDYAREERGNHEGDLFVQGGVDAPHLGSNLILTNGDKTLADFTAANQPHDDDNQPHHRQHQVVVPQPIEDWGQA